MLMITIMVSKALNTHSTFLSVAFICTLTEILISYNAQYLTLNLGKLNFHLSLRCHQISFFLIYMTDDPSPKQFFLMTVEEADKEDSSGHSEVLITDIPMHGLKQYSSYANYESFGHISK